LLIKEKALPILSARRPEKKIKYKLRSQLNVPKEVPPGPADAVSRPMSVEYYTLANSVLYFLKRKSIQSKRNKHRNAVKSHCSQKSTNNR